MPELPRVTGHEAILVFGRVGFVLVRVRGSHHVLKREGHRFLLTVPVHGKEPLAPGTLRTLIRDAGLTVEAFIALLANDG